MAARRPSTGSPRFYVGDSEIHGRGLFAAVGMPRDTQIGVFAGPRTTRDGPHVLWVHDEDGSVYGIRGTNELRFINHSERPNAALYGDELWSLRRIRRGEEITIHYGPDWADG